MSFFRNSRCSVRSVRIVCQRHFSMLTEIPMGPPDKILGLNVMFKEDKSPLKVNLGVGAYRDNEGKPVVLNVVREAERRIMESKLDHEYAGIDGIPEYVNLSLRFAYGNDPKLIERIAAVQSISGTGACRLAGEFLSKFLGKGTKIYLPNPTWPNHIPIMKNAGLDPQQYNYFNAEGCNYDHQGCLRAVREAPHGSVFLFHACAHNPTGCDPSKQQWVELSQAVKEKRHIVFIDCAYQGFASGDAEKDAFALRQFVKDGHETILLAQSFAKNFGLYGERVGTMSVVCKDIEEKKRVDSQLKLIVRPMYSNPPVYGARIVKEVLGDTALTAQWRQECKGMADRIIDMRKMLKSKLLQVGSKMNWDHLTDQIGMFAFTGLKPEQVLIMRSKYHIYCTDDGRISMPGVNTANVQHIAEAIHEVSK